MAYDWDSDRKEYVKVIKVISEASSFSQLEPLDAGEVTVEEAVNAYNELLAKVQG